MASSFSAQIASAVAEIKGALDGIVLEATQSLLEEANRPTDQGGNLKVDTGFLRNSLSVAINAEPIGPVEKPKGYDEPDRNLAPQIEASIAGYQSGDTIMARWTASYARYQEYGSRGRAGRAFVRQAAQRWQVHVDQAAAKILARLNGR